MIIYDPAMCCPTGLCGPSIDENLLRVHTAINRLKNRGIVVERYNLSDNPQAFIENEKVNNLLVDEGVDVLPVTVVDGEIVKTKEYPTNEEFCKFLEVPEEYLMSELSIRNKKRQQER